MLGPDRAPVSAAGRTLQLRLLDKHDELWVALTDAYPARW
jgi:hypothetical protein